MKQFEKTVTAIVCVFLFVIVLSSFSGCASITKVYRNDKAPAITNNYTELYFIKPEKDPRNAVPQVIEQFKNMGYKVREVEPGKPIEGAQGTGFLISGEGDILTCAHVVGEEKNATVWIAGARYEADVLTKDKDVDMALLRTRTKIATNYSPLSFRRDRAYQLGEDVMTIGFPMTNLLGNRARLSRGLVSSTVGMKDDPKQIQFSAEVQPGNSGGPLFDKDGVVVGLVTGTLNPWKMVQSTGGALPQNVNFAIKSDIVLSTIKSKNEAVYNKIMINGNSTVARIEGAVVKVRSGIIPEELEKKPKLVATISYQSFWDIWYRFRYFVISIFDFDTQELLFRVGQVGDVAISNETVVINDTMDKVRKTLNK